MFVMRANGSHCHETPSCKISRTAFGPHCTCVFQLKVYASFSINPCLAVMLYTP